MESQISAVHKNYWLDHKPLEERNPMIRVIRDYHSAESAQQIAGALAMDVPIVLHLTSSKETGTGACDYGYTGIFERVPNSRTRLFFASNCDNYENLGRQPFVRTETGLLVPFHLGGVKGIDDRDLFGRLSEDMSVKDFYQVINGSFLERAKTDGLTMGHVGAPDILRKYYTAQNEVNQVLTDLIQ